MDAAQREDELRRLLRPAGRGVFLLSTGRGAQERDVRRFHGLLDDAPEEAIGRVFEERLARLAEARVLILGAPSDIGAGYRRGANLGPSALRRGLLDAVPDLEGVLDLGDILVVPQLLEDDMLSAETLREVRTALFGDALAALPVAPLSILARVLEHVRALAPEAKLLVLGGDHSVATPLALHLARHRRIAIVQLDAHTDLLPSRLGIRTNYATWAHHANDALGRGGRLVQVGVRASGRDRAHWESTLEVRQFWADACNADPNGVLDAILAHLAGLDIEGVYLSNDLDGTDAQFASLTGTPEPGGLHPDFVERLIMALAEGPGLLAADLVEFAPEVEAPATARDASFATAQRYLRTTLKALGRPASSRPRG